MIKLLNSVVDRSGFTYSLFVEINKSSLEDHFDVRFFSTYTGASDPSKEQTKWRTTLPRTAFHNLVDGFSISGLT